MSAHLVACHECDLLQRLPEVTPGTQARCGRCGYVLARPKADSIDRTVALLVAGVFLFLIFDTFPFLAFKKEGFVQQSHLVTGIVQLFRQDMISVALLVTLTTVIAPGLQLLLLLYVLLPLRFGRRAPGMFRVFRYLNVLQPWGMVEVFMLGVLVSIVKLAKMATIVPGPAVWSLVGLMFVLAAASTALDPHEVWSRWQPAMRHPLPATLNSGLVGCGVCHLLVPALDPPARARCPRCGAALHRRKPNSLHRTWALVIAALIFYIPANLLPITTVTSLGMTQADTIMSGVIYFLHEGAWYIAAVIFIASVFVPLMKLIILIYLLISVQNGSTARMKDRTRLYRITEAVGRWSMVDIFVVTILVALVNLGALATLQAGPAAPFFAAVVVVTMFAAMSFDPRLIWDAKEHTHG